MVKGRIIINTGDGKGKTTAALGCCFRAMGHGLRVCVIQFLKGKGDYGERLFAQHIEGLEWHVCGKGFVFNKKDKTQDRIVAEEGFELAVQKMQQDDFDLIILDEITYLVSYDFLSSEKIVAALKERPERLNVILTGRDAHPSLVDIADTVTRMDVVKHAYAAGVKAQKGIEF